MSEIAERFRTRAPARPAISGGEPIWRRLAQRLVRAADARDLAIDIVGRHGAQALAIVDTMLAGADLAASDREVLTIARREIARLAV